MKRVIRASDKRINQTVHFHNGHKIVKIWYCGQVGYSVQGMPDGFYKDPYYSEGIFTTLKDAKKFADKYEAEHPEES